MWLRQPADRANLKYQAIRRTKSLSMHWRTLLQLHREPWKGLRRGGRLRADGVHRGPADERGVAVCHTRTIAMLWDTLLRTT